MSNSPRASRRTPRIVSVLGYLSAALLAVWCSPTIIPAEAGDDRLASLLDPPSVPEQLHFPVVQIRRDPFTPSREIEDGSDMPLGDDGVGIVLPSNAGAGPEAFAAPRNGAEPRLRAVILGTAPKALIDMAGRSILVGIGSRLLNSVVASIRKDGITLQDGESLYFTEGRP